MKIAIARRKVVMPGESGIRGCQEPFAVDEHRPLEAIGVDILHEHDVARLVNAEAHPGPRAEPVVQVQLSITVLEAIGVAAVQGAARARLAADVGSDPERNEMRNVAGDVDVGAAHVEGAGLDRIAVRVLDGRSGGEGVIGEQHHSELDRRSVVRGLRALWRRGRGLPPGERGPQERSKETHRDAKPSHYPTDVFRAGGILRSRNENFFWRSLKGTPSTSTYG